MREKINKKRKQKKERKKRGKKGGELRTIEFDSSALPVKGETFWTCKINFFSDIDPRWASRGLPNRFWVALGKDWKDFWSTWEGLGKIFLYFWLPLGRFVQEAFEMIWGGF